MAVIMFMSMSLIPYALDIVLPLNESRPFLPPYRGYYFVDMQDYFFEILSHSIVAWAVTVSGLVAHDCMFVTFVEHVCSMFAVVGKYVYYTFRYTNIDSDNRDEHFFATSMLLFITKMVLALQEKLQCFFFEIAQGNEDTLEAIRYIFYVFGQMIHLFFLSFEGQRLIDHSLQMRDKIYNSCWYSASIKLQKLIILVMMKSLYPSFLSAGKIYILSLESFTTVLQTSMSYLTVLTSMQ
nr:PREDICTED: putative odorant receptor 85d [Linepithema humile]